MSRPSSMVQRPLTLTEELEKLEQSITLTLQEIDHNFSQAHRIVTTSILPLVEQYSENSRDVWEGAKFWKQFFEASANVSLSGYEEKPTEDTETTVQDDDGEDPTATTTEGLEADESSANVTQSNLADNNPDDSGLDEGNASHHRPDDLDLTELDVSSHSTPRAPPPQEKPGEADATAASAYSPSTSPYETLKKQVDESESPFDMDESTNLPTTPQPGKSKPSFRQYRGATPGSPSSSPFVPPVSHEKKPKAGYGHSSKPSDPVMHRMPDKTYRVQATPLKGHRITPKTNTPARKYPLDDSPLSSPEPEAPKLHEEIFSSPIKGLETPGTGRKRRLIHSGTPGRAGGTPGLGGLRTPQPGTSILTPAKGKAQLWDSDDDDELLGGGGGGGGGADFTDDGFSPPKTMQFHIPQSRLMKTPAKEASKKIVEDLLVTAGAGDDITDSVGEQSPSLIRRAEGLEDESF